MLEPIPSTLKVHLVQKLRDAILAGKYKPGERLNESLIAREFEISRIPVREALIQLQESGLVMNLERRGMFVTQLSTEDVQKINSVRIILETEALKLARAHMTPEIAAKLTSLVDQMDEWQGSLPEAAALDFRFHRTIWEAAGNSYLLKTLSPLTTVLFAYETLEHVSHEIRRWRLSHHRALLQVALNRSDEEPQHAMLMHLRMSYADPERYSSLVAPPPPPPPALKAPKESRRASAK